MQESDTFAGLIAFLFEQDRKAHPPPGDLIEKILQDVKKQGTDSS